MRPNRQTGHVGNPCDMHKHAALVTLAEAMAVRFPRGLGLRYMETHAFRPHAPLAFPGWVKAVAALGADFPAFERYRALEWPHVQQGTYRCSVGLAREILPMADMHLAERHGATRRRLRAEMNPARARVVPHARELGTFVGAPGPLLALVDPFRMRGKVWRWARLGVEALWGTGHVGVVLMFDYRSNGTRPDWPPPFPGWRGPVAWRQARPCLLAVYGTPGTEGWIREALLPLGWNAQE